MWLARNRKTTHNKKPHLYLFEKYPSVFSISGHDGWIRSSKDLEKFYILDPDLFPNVTFDDGPVEILNVEIDRIWRELKDFLTVYTLKFQEDGKIKLVPKQARKLYYNL